ncbi:WD40-repeat-containing domain protein [Entophlyctis helioformis]|nr:WD40-repeat-containing domain protein [Entophlyctis helioformis]
MMQQHPDHAMTNANGDDANVPAKRMRLDDGSLPGPPTQRQKLPSTVSTPVLTPQGMKGPPPLSEAHTSQMAPMHGHPSASYQHGQHGQNGQALAQGYPPAAGRTATPPSGSVQPRTAAPQAMPMQQSAQRPPQGDANGTASAATAMQPAAPATPHVDNAPTTGFIDFDARKASDEGRILGEDYACYVNPESESARNPPLHVEPVHTFRVQSVVCCVRFSPDGRYLGVGCSKSTEIYDVETFQRVCALVDDTSRKDYYVRSVAFSPDGNFIASGAEDHLVRICDINRQSIKSRLSGHQLDIYSIDWSKDGKFVASASGDRTVRLWDPETGASLMTLSCDEDPTRSPNTDQSKDTGVTSVAIRPSDSRCVAAGTIDDTIRLWDTRTGQLLERFVGHLNSVYAVAFSPTGLSLVSGSLDKTLRVWDLSQNTLDQLANPNPPPAAPAHAPGTVADPSRKSRTFINTKPRHVFRGHKDFILSVAFPGKGSSLGAVDRQGRPLWSSIPIPEIEWIVCASKDRHVTIWDGSVPGTTPTAVPVCLLSGHRNSVISIAVSSAGGLMATGSGDMRTRIWRVSRRTDAQPAPDVKPNVTNASAAPASAQPPPAASTPTIPAPSPRLDVKGEPRPSSVRAASPAPAPLASHNSMAAQAQPQAYHAASPAPGSAAPPKPAVQPAGPLAAATTSGGTPSNAAPSPAATAAQVAPPVSAAADQPQDAERAGLRASPAPTAAPAPAAPQTKPVVEPAVAVHKDDDGDAEMEMEEGEEREMDLDLDFPPPTAAAAAPMDGSDAAKNGTMSAAEASE